MKWTKVLRKGLETGLPAALGAFGVSNSASTAITTFIVGAIFGGGKNWWKHRKFK
jgi:hypothetical protein